MFCVVCGLLSTSQLANEIAAASSPTLLRALDVDSSSTPPIFCISGFFFASDYGTSPPFLGSSSPAMWSWVLNVVSVSVISETRSCIDGTISCFMSFPRKVRMVIFPLCSVYWFSLGRSALATFEGFEDSRHRQASSCLPSLQRTSGRTRMNGRLLSAGTVVCDMELWYVAVHILH